MVFTDLTFLFGFLPVVWLLYRYVSRTHLANLYILIVSLLFYAWGGLTSLLTLLIILLWNYGAAHTIGASEDEHTSKIMLWTAIGVDLFIVLFYRYIGVWFGFLSPTLSRLPSLMPMGLSFYMFSCMSCLFDVYYGRAEAPASFVEFGVFAAFFGRINMGPIAHYAKMKEQLEDHPTSRQKTFDGMTLFLQGLFRKVILADNFALIFAALAGNTSWVGSLLYGFAYFFQLYFDFSGYSRMARGIGSLFGFTIDPNFSMPYMALSVQEFWRRWHISLTSWFRQYVYIPMGGNRVSHTRWILNVLTVWVLTGLYHGATLPFLVWGLYQGALILAENQWINKFMEKMPHWVRHIYLVLTQLIGWTFFFSPTLLGGLSVIGRYFFIGVSSFADADALFVLCQSIFLLILAIVLSSGLSVYLGRLVHRLFPKASSVLVTVSWCLVFLICVSFLVSATAQTFLYAAF